MTKTQNAVSPTWLKGELKLADILDNRIIDLLSAIEQSGSLNQAAKKMGLSYKGAWQIIERVNNSAPKALITTMTGGSKGGGSCLTETGRGLLMLFKELQQQHNVFLAQLNQNLANNPDIVLLLQRLVVKTSAKNQLFGRVLDIQIGKINAEIIVKLKGDLQIVVATDLNVLNELDVKSGADTVLLINGEDLTLIANDMNHHFSARNQIVCSVLLIQEKLNFHEITVLLPNGDTLITTITFESLMNLNLSVGSSVLIIFKANAPILGIRE